MECPDCRHFMKKINDIFGKTYYFCEQCGYNTYNKVKKKLINDNSHQKSRKELVKFLLEEYEYGAITENEIMDMLIDLEIYNKECERKKIK